MTESVYIWTTSSWLGVLICFKAERFYSGVWIGWINRFRQIVWGSRRLSAMSCTWFATTLHNTTDLGKNGWKAAWWKSTREFWSIASWIWARSIPRYTGRPIGEWLVSEISSCLVSELVWPEGLGNCVCPCTQHWWSHTSNSQNCNFSKYL